VTLPDRFQFSQGSLQDYADCPRRFQLRFVLMQPWPALVTESPAEAEEHMRRGADLHHLIHQHALGLEAERLEAMIHDPILRRWWRTYMEHPPADVPEAVRRTEVVLAAPVAGRRLVARLDLLAVEPGQRAVIVDWKTPFKRPSRSTLAQRLQTRVYRTLAVRAVAPYNGGRAPEPEQVTMVYWFAQSNGATERFPYDTQQFAADATYLTGLVSEIASRQEPMWPLTPDPGRCRFCNYRSLCERAVKGSFVEELEDDLEATQPEIDLEQIAEIAF